MLVASLLYNLPKYFHTYWCGWKGVCTNPKIKKTKINFKLIFPAHNHFKYLFCPHSFSFEPTDQCSAEILKMFSVVPQRGTLTAVDRPAQVQVVFRSTKEVVIKDQPILRCRVIEPNIGEEGEIIASIPIKLSVKSVYSK